MANKKKENEEMIESVVVGNNIMFNAEMVNKFDVIELTPAQFNFLLQKGKVISKDEFDAANKAKAVEVVKEPTEKPEVDPEGNAEENASDSIVTNPEKGLDPKTGKAKEEVKAEK